MKWESSLQEIVKDYMIHLDSLNHHIWTDKISRDFYNAFIHPSREKGHSVLFYQEVIHDLDSGVEEINMWTDDWNIAAQKWAIKTGFKVV